MDQPQGGPSSSPLRQPRGALAGRPHRSADGVSRLPGSQTWSWVERDGVQEAPGARGAQDTWHKVVSQHTLCVGNSRGYMVAASGLGPQGRAGRAFHPGPGLQLDGQGGQAV